MVSALGEPDAIDVRADDLPLKLFVGPFKGSLTATSPGDLHSAGSSAFVQIDLSSDNRSRRGLTAELAMETENGEIVQIHGSGVDADGEGARRVARIKGIRKGRSRTVLIEIRLKHVPEGSRNRLRLALAAPENGGDRQDTSEGGKSRQSVSLAWRVANCGEQYHTALQEIGRNGGNDLRALLREARSADKTMSRRWMFRPSRPARSRSKTDDETGRVARKQASALYSEASALVSAGYDRILRSKGPHGWMLDKTANDLRKYFSQDMNPALCTGALAFVSYYAEKLEPLGKRRERRARFAGLAEQFAREKAGDVFEAARTVAGGHPAWGGATLITLKPRGSETQSMQALLVDLLKSTGFPKEQVDEVANAANAYDALKRIDEQGLKSDTLTKAMRGKLREAVASIEMAVRLAAFRDRYEVFWDGFHGRLDAIRAAHAQHCVCGS
ncbi:MAG: hypothetical protein ACFCUR_06050 [Rhodomicrobiaceae bacterium]